MKSRRPALLLALALLGPVAAHAAEPTHGAAREAPAAASTEGRLAEGWRSIRKGLASWYGAAFQGKPTASGEPYDMHDLTAAHRSLPFGTIVEVRNPSNGRTVEVRINDRGPYVGKRIIDLSRAAAQKLGLLGRGVKSVEIRVAQLPDEQPAPERGGAK